MREPSTTERERTAATPRPRWRRWLRDLLLILVVVFAVQWWQSRHLAAGTAPPLSGQLVDGSSYRLNAADGPTLVHFWAEWCPVCRLEQDNIEAIAGNLPVVSVATTSGDTAAVSAYLHEHGLQQAVLMDETGDLAGAWGVKGVPASFVVDRDGRISYAGMGYATEWGLRLRLWLARW